MKKQTTQAKSVCSCKLFETNFKSYCSNGVDKPFFDNLGREFVICSLTFVQYAPERCVTTLKTAV